ncbi:MAG: hypothetical protein RLZZ58_1689, partial [Pseudomonadota bacterium]
MDQQFASERPKQRLLAGIALRLLAVVALALMLAAAKLAAARGVHLAETLFWRQAFALPIVIGWALATRQISTFRPRRMGAHVRRSAMGMVGLAFNFGGIIMLPMAEATTIAMSMPIFAVIMAALVLREPVGRWRWTAVAMGFAGILLVIQPGGSGGFSAGHLTGALVALCGAIMTAAISIALRDLGRTEPAVAIVFWFSLLSSCTLGLALPFVYAPHDMDTWALLVAVGIFGGVAQLGLTGALRLAPVSAVLPMDYTGLLWSILIGAW